MIKICGITTPALADAAVDAGADAVGVVFAPGSPRRVEPDAAESIRTRLPSDVVDVGLFQDPDPATDLPRWRGRWIQLHGTEDESLVASAAARGSVIRGFRFDPSTLARWDACPDVSILLVDGSAGGEGHAFDHAALAALMAGLRKPVMLAGGLTPERVGAAVRAVRPFAVDVSSGVEVRRGVKDPALMRAFCAAVRAVDAELSG
jgi:phosphoribosylanthranilate isomerase